MIRPDAADELLMTDLTGRLAGSISERRLLALLFTAIAAGFFLNLGGVPLFDLDEGAFSEATREMFERGDFISTYLNGVPRYDKPILIYWLQAASVLAFGLNEFALRLPSAIAACLWVGVIYGFTKEFIDRRTALVAGIIAATAFGVTVIGKAATADALLNLLVAAAMLDGYRYYRLRKNRLLYRAFLWMGLGVLTKGPVAILIPFAVTLAFFAWRGEFKLWLRAIFNPVGILILVAVALPWYVVQYLKEGDAFIQGFFLKHNVGRFQGPMEGHSGSLFYYVPIVLVMVLPYTSLLLSALRRVREAARDDLALYLWLWFGFVLVFFSFSGTKLPHYVLYGSTPLFILMARYRDGLKSGLWALLPALLFFGLMWALPDLVKQAQPRIRDEHVRALLSDTQAAFGWDYRLFLGLAVALTLYLIWEKRYAVWSKLLLIGLVNAAVLSLFVLPAVGTVQQEPIRQAGLVARGLEGPVVMWRMNTPSFSVYSQRVTPRRDPQPGDAVLTQTRYLPALDHYEVLYEQRGVALVRVLEPNHDPAPR